MGRANGSRRTGLARRNGRRRARRWLFRRGHRGTRRRLVRRGHRGTRRRVMGRATGCGRTRLTRRNGCRWLFRRSRVRRPAGRSLAWGGVLAPGFLTALRDHAHGIAVERLAPDVPLLACVGSVRTAVRLAKIRRVGVLPGDLAGDLLGDTNLVTRACVARHEVVGAAVVGGRQRRNRDGDRADDRRQRQRSRQLRGDRRRALLRRRARLVAKYCAVTPQHVRIPLPVANRSRSDAMGRAHPTHQGFHYIFTSVPATRGGRTAKFQPVTASTAAASSGRQTTRSGSFGSARLYANRDPSIREVCRPAARATATGAAESHSYCPPACTYTSATP